MEQAMRRMRVHAAHLCLDEGEASSSAAAAAAASFADFDAPLDIDESFATPPCDVDGALTLEAEDVAAAGPFAESLKRRSLSVVALKRFLDGEHADVKEAARRMLANEKVMAPYTDLKMRELRELTMEWTKTALRDAPVGLRDLHDNPSRFFAWVETLANFDANLLTKLAVQMSLWGGTIMNLGTERHQHMLRDIETLKLPGCFLMTELGHGSNVRGIETTATYDRERREFVVHSPTFTSTKYWIGNAAMYALKGTVFARLIHDGKDKGVHAFVADLRDSHGRVLPGVEIFDCGEKMGLNGIDNGAVRFHHYRIPREAMLNRFADVTEDGAYVNKCENEGRHFGATVGELSGGRVLIGSGSVTIAKVALAIAIRYGWARPQFGPNDAEVPIMTYPTHQVRLMPLLASTLAFDSFLKYVSKTYSNRTEETVPFGHSLTAGLKAAASWHMNKTLQTTRECCGGQGFRAKNRFGHLKADTDVFLTFEGDNTVLMQQVARFLVGTFTAMSRSRRFTGILSYMGSENAIKEAADPIATLSCAKCQASVLQKREALLLRKLVGKVADLQKKGMSQYDAWHMNLNLVVKVANAHIDRLVNEVFTASIAAANLPADVAEMLRIARALDGVARINGDLGTVAAHQLLSVAAVQAVPDALEALSAQLTPYSPDIVEAFAIPAKCLPQADLMEV